MRGIALFKKLDSDDHGTVIAGFRFNDPRPCKYQSFGWGNLKILARGMVHCPIAFLHSDMEFAANAQININLNGLHTQRCEPFAHQRSIAPSTKDPLTRGFYYTLN